MQLMTSPQRGGVTSEALRGVFLVLFEASKQDAEPLIAGWLMGSDGILHRVAAYPSGPFGRRSRDGQQLIQPRVIRPPVFWGVRAVRDGQLFTVRAVGDRPGNRLITDPGYDRTLTVVQTVHAVRALCPRSSCGLSWASSERADGVASVSRTGFWSM